MTIRPWKSKPDDGKVPSKLDALFKRGALSNTTAFKRDRIDAIVRNVTSETRTPGAIQAYFDHIPQQKVEALRANYPQLAKCLFDMAQRSVDGSYGKLIQENAQSISNVISSEDAIFPMALFHACRSHEIIPEIFFSIPTDDLHHFEQTIKDVPAQQLDRILLESDGTLPKPLQAIRQDLKRLIKQMKLDPTNRLVAIQLFQKYLANAASPSHVMVNLLLDEGSIEKSISMAQALKNPGEKSKAYVQIVDQLLNKNQIDQALALLDKLKFTQEHLKPLSHLVDKLFYHGRNVELEKTLSANQIDDIVHLATRIKEPLEKQRTLQKIAVGLAKNKQASTALNVAFLVTNFEAQSYTLSSIVQALSHHGLYKQAKEICNMITEPGSKEDAQCYIVRAYADDKLFNEAIEFVQSITNPAEKSKAAKILLRAAAASNAAAIVDEVQKKFTLRL